jgi:ATP adenylyltransferase
LDRLWSPWRSQYVASGGSNPSECVFCELQREPARDEQNFVLHRAAGSYVVLNLYPYATGHLLVVPYAHLPQLDDTEKETSDELMDLCKRCQTALREVYRPDGFNLGMNLGTAAGAGVVNHIHIHILPRWAGDTNFMTSVGETRVMPEELQTTYQKLRNKF